MVAPLVIKKVQRDLALHKRVIKALWSARTIWYHRRCLKEKLEEAKGFREWLRANT